MHPQEHSIVREGLVTGLLGAVVVAVWYCLVDSAAGGSFLGVAVMGWYLLRRHPGIREVGRPLGDEVDAPPDPRGRTV